jgi:hypothetical protein
MMRNRADRGLVSCWKRVMSGNMKSRDRFFHKYRERRGVEMVERRGTNGGSGSVGLNMMLDDVE